MTSDSGTASALRALAGHAAMYGIARAAVSGMDLLLTPVYARVLLPSDVGLIAVSISIQTAIGIVYTLGLDGALFRLFYYPEATEQDRRAATGAILAGSTCIAMTGAGVLSLLGPELFGGLLADMGSRVFLLLVWGSVFHLYPLLLLQVLQMRQQSGRYLLWACGYTTTRALATIYALTDLRLGTEGWAGAFALTALCAAIVACLALRRQISLDRMSRILRDAAGYALPNFGHQSSRWLAVAASRPVLASMLPLSQVGVYHIAFAFGQAMALAVTAFSLAYGPAFMEAARRSEADASRRFGKLASIAVTLAVALAGLGSMWRDPAVAVVAGPQYAAAGQLIPVVLLDVVLQCIYLSLASPVFLRKESVKRLPIRTAASGAVGLGGIVLLIPYAGVAGAAWAMVLADLVLISTVFPLSQHALRMQYDYGLVARSCAVTGAVLVGSSVLTVIAGTTIATAGTVTLSVTLLLYASNQAKRDPPKVAPM